MFLGEELTGIMQAIADGRTYSRRAKCEVEIGVHVLPKFSMDSSDRNRTSPFAFTGNKFEFRMPGSSQSIASVNVILNTIMAEQFELFADELEKASDINQGITDIIKRVMKDHGKIIFNGNNYSDEWTKEAERRGLLNLPSTIDALPYLTSPKNVDMFKRLHVFSEAELKSREDIYVQNYCKLLNIEAMTMLDMATMDIIPAVIKYKGDVAKSANASITLGVDADEEKEICKDLASHIKDATECVNALKSALQKAHSLGENVTGGRCYHDEVLVAMANLRKVVDEMELLTAKEYWPVPSYGDLLFSVH